MISDIYEKDLYYIESAECVVNGKLTFEGAFRFEEQAITRGFI